MPVYFIQAGEGGPVKIGHTANVRARLESFQIGNHEHLSLLRAIEGAGAEERWLHRQFSSLRLRGEWFAYCPTMLTVAPPRGLPVRTRGPRSAALERALKAAGGVAALARALGCSRQRISWWRQVPPIYVLKVEDIIRGAVRCYEMRPDVYPPAQYGPGGKHFYQIPKREAA